MITLYRLIRIWQMRIKFKFDFYVLFDIMLKKGTKHILENSEDIEKKFVHEIAKIIHDTNMNKTDK